MTSPRIVFAGTPAFALASLDALVTAGFTPIGVLTQPDRPAGRGRRLTASPVKEYANEIGIPVMQPNSLRDAETVDRLAMLCPDLMIVAAYGLLLPQRVLDLPAQGCLNVHASLLPRWRGAAPIQAAILAGDSESGISLMGMEAGLDTGPVFARDSIAIRSDMTAGQLHDELAELGGALLTRCLAAILDGAPAERQDDTLATYAGKIQTADTALDWSQSAISLDRAVRAYNPVPGARFRFGDEWVKCWEASPVADGGGEPGRATDIGRDAITVGCGEDSLRLRVLQRPGRRRISAAEFIQQTGLKSGDILARHGSVS